MNTGWGGGGPVPEGYEREAAATSIGGKIKQFFTGRRLVKKETPIGGLAEPFKIKTDAIQDTSNKDYLRAPSYYREQARLKAEADAKRAAEAPPDYIRR
jgi:hypothetical protein